MSGLPYVGDQFAGYRLQSVLGRGGMSVVYQAENLRLGTVVALKVMAPELAGDDVFRARFLEESRIAASLNHPNVVPIHDVGSQDGLLYIVMRYVSGTDMRQIIKKRGRILPETALFLLGQAARALDFAHRRGLVHRDLKPGNLLVERGSDDADPDHVYVADFGITKHITSGSSLTPTGQFLGTIDYVAPEQIRGTPVGALADQYSLGCVLYECLTGRVPFEKDLDAAIIWAHVEETPTMPTVLRPELPPEVDEVFRRVMAKRPDERYASCREFIGAARVALGTRGSGDPVTGHQDAVAGYRQTGDRDAAAGGERARAAAGKEENIPADSGTPPGDGGRRRGSPWHRRQRPAERARDLGGPGFGSGGTGEGEGSGPSAGTRGLPAVRRYLVGRFPDTVRPGQVFSLLVSVARSVGAPPEGSAPLKPFEVPASGRQLMLLIDAPGLRVLGQRRQMVLVPPGGDSEPVKFDLIGDKPGPQRMSVTAWDGGSYLGELAIEISVERDSPARPDRTEISEARAERTDGEVTLLVRYDPHQMAYRFEFIDVDYPDEVTSQLVYDPGPAVERLIRRLDALADDTAGYSAAATRAYLVNEGVTLWQELVPEQLRSQFWERQRRITQLTILTNRDVVPWELLHPKDRGHDAGFLVEQFPVTRAIYGHARQRRLRLHPARFVVPPNSPADAQAEARALARLLGTRLTTVSELMPLLQLISKGRFGLLHFACHNRFDPGDGSSIKLDSHFTPTFLATAASDQTLAKARPIVFINACRSLGQVPSYNKLDGWADKFLRAGAAAFIGSLWDVSDGMAREFAQELYQRLAGGDPMGTAVMAARHAAAAQPGDPTWLAYAVYGDPQARIEVSPR
jgi:hypothetical protein